MSFKSTVISIFAVFVIALMLSEGEPKPYAHWSYEGDEGPENWSLLDERYNICEQGVNQSPINIVLNNAIDANLSELEFTNKSKALSFENNGHALQVNFSSGNNLKLDNKTYTLRNIHFHTPSENKIDGKSFPMEAHLVHTIGSKKLVVSVMFEEGKDNLFVNKLLRNLPTEDENKKELKSDVLAYDILPSSKEYYTFNGSLTTPPCDEGVKWIVLKDPVKISKSQLKDFTDSINNNNRPLQDINARFILK